MNIRTGREEKVIAALTADEAGSWDARLRAPDCTETDRTRFAAWRDADPSHRTAFEDLQTIVATLRHDRGRADVRALRDEALRAMSNRRRQRVWWAAAASGVLALGIGFTLWKTPDWLQVPLSDLTARLTGTEIYKTGTGQRSTFTLEDGSSVELNAQSRIEVDFSESQRSVQLVKGQALFSVAKNTRRPFIVRAGNRNIVAVGTQFDVRVDSNSVQVTLIEGKVRVERPSSESASARSTRERLQNDEILLTPGKQFVARLNPSLSSGSHGKLREAGGKSLHEEAAPGEGEASVRNIDVAKVISWREGRIFLEDLSLQDAVEEMNKHSAVQIAIEDPILAQLRVNGMFKAGEQEAFVAALEDYFPVAIRHRGDQEIVLTSR